MSDNRNTIPTNLELTPHGYRVFEEHPMTTPPNPPTPEAMSAAIYALCPDCGYENKMHDAIAPIAGDEIDFTCQRCRLPFTVVYVPLQAVPVPVVPVGEAMPVGDWLDTGWVDLLRSIADGRTTHITGRDMCDAVITLCNSYDKLRDAHLTHETPAAPGAGVLSEEQFAEHLELACSQHSSAVHAAGLAIECRESGNTELEATYNANIRLASEWENSEKDLLKAHDAALRAQVWQWREQAVEVEQQYYDAEAALRGQLATAEGEQAQLEALLAEVFDNGGEAIPSGLYDRIQEYFEPSTEALLAGAGEASDETL